MFESPIVTFSGVWLFDSWSASRTNVFGMCRRSHLINSPQLVTAQIAVNFISIPNTLAFILSFFHGASSCLFSISVDDVTQFVSRVKNPSGRFSGCLLWRIVKNVAKFLCKSIRHSARECFQLIKNRRFSVHVHSTLGQHDKLLNSNREKGWSFTFFSPLEQLANIFA
jgi:hypothetical protein